MLKTLEEPPKNSYFILITSSPDQLLPTVLSRCQQVRFNLLSATEIETALEKWADLEEKERIFIAGLAQGSLRRALELTGEDLKSLKQHAVDLLRTAFKNPSQRAAYAQELARQVDRRYLKEVLENLILWLRDAFHISLLGEEQAQKYLANVDDLETLSRFVNNFPRFNYDQAIQEIDRSVNMLDRYVQPLLVLSVLLKILGQCGRGQVQEKAA
ncbi:MAG: hypothetical protein D6814_05890 [Calditrichaeota bacterium]|nr:MAG: hypothetical protein D6814_05890 [Calditrichota bacterium]